MACARSVLSVNMDADVRRRLTEEADKEQRSMAQIVNTILRKELGLPATPKNPARGWTRKPKARRKAVKASAAP